MQIVTVLTQKPGEGSVGVACNVAASGPRSHQRFGARAYQLPALLWSSGSGGASRVSSSRVRPGPHQESEEPKGICVLLRVGDPVGDGTRCEIWTNHFRAVHAKELGKP